MTESTQKLIIEDKLKNLCFLGVTPKGTLLFKTEELVNYISSLAEQVRREIVEEEENKRYCGTCDGCPEGHPSFWKTITESEEWKAWEKEVSRRMQEPEMKGAFDVDECRECGWFSPEHFKEFLKFTLSEKTAKSS